ncbi:hypothetical protein B484DRAFT_453807 [Ochromonadaceae sp. CCMP2298]|nr:hypothetical protein B484DRAFT_453807 [Ochromonadaceae sp. CCMP2298]
MLSSVLLCLLLAFPAADALVGLRQAVRPALASRAPLHLGMEATSMLTSILQRVDPSQAQGEFYFFFFAGSGALGIGFAQIPKLLAGYKEVQALAGGTSLGGDNFQGNPLGTIGFPEPLKAADVQYIIDNMPSTEKMASLGKGTSYMSQLGYIEREGFNKALPKGNPLALFAAFDALGEGGGDLAAPQRVEAIAAGWKEGGQSQFSADLAQANVRKYSAYAVFFFLIGLVLDLIIESGANAFL